MACDREAQQEYQDVYSRVLTEKLREVAERFDSIHTAQRAHEVGSLDAIVAPSALRPALIQAIEEGLRDCGAPEPARPSAADHGTQP